MHNINNHGIIDHDIKWSWPHSDMGSSLVIITVMSMMINAWHHWSWHQWLWHQWSWHQLSWTQLYPLLRYGILKPWGSRVIITEMSMMINDYDTNDTPCPDMGSSRGSSLRCQWWSMIMTSIIMTSMTPPAQIWDPQPNCCPCRCHQWQAWSQGLQSWWWRWYW